MQVQVVGLGGRKKKLGLFEPASPLEVLDALPQLTDLVAAFRAESVGGHGVAQAAREGIAARKSPATTATALGGGGRAHRAHVMAQRRDAAAATALLLLLPWRQRARAE